tara:strand:- start:10579 stop:11997 length:1419 start_codon:yes stop_codon:yes gene_type:complete
MISLLLAILSPFAFANSIDWSGTYRFESVYVSNADLVDDSKNYFLHHLVLKPHIVAADGMHIYGRFDILNNDDSRYSDVNNQLGSYLGDSPASSEETNDLNSRALQSAQKTSYLNVSQLYLRWVQEHGNLLVGRAPKHFGLGIHYNAGDGLFDHWLTTHDVVAYQMIWGNIYFQPYFAKVEEGNVNQNSSDTQEVGIVINYENPETDLKMGAYYEERKNSAGLRSGTGLHPFGGADSLSYGGYEHQNWSLFLAKDYGKFAFDLEVGFNSGDTGVLNKNNEQIDLDAFAVIAELDYQYNEKWNILLNMGMVTGDDPDTDGTYEGYWVHRNYNIATLLFNHPIGQLSVNNVNYATSTTNAYSAADIDSDRVSNVMYFTPGFEYYFNDRWTLKSQFVYAQLMEDPRGTGDAPSVSNGSKDLGYELDVGLSYQPIERVKVKLDLGYLDAGDAFKGGSQNYNIDSIYGFETGIAVRF